MEKFIEISNRNLSEVCGGSKGSEIVLGALSGAYQAGQSCILGGPQMYALCALGGAVVGGAMAYSLYG